MPVEGDIARLELRADPIRLPLLLLDAPLWGLDRWWMVALWAFGWKEVCFEISGRSII
jgi:hypothetical protein